MFNSRYSEPEMQQWHDACLNSANSGADAMHHDDTPCHTDTRTSMAKGQAEKQQPRTAFAAMQMQASQTQTLKHDWASECLFDWYNS